MTSSVGEIIVSAMACHGADYAFCVPGKSYLPVLDAFHHLSVALHAARQDSADSCSWCSTTAFTG